MFFNELVECMEKDGDELMVKSQNSMWKGIVDYWRTNGQDSNYLDKKDKWGILNPGRDGLFVDYLRTEPAPFGNENMIVIEPCNYVSNVSYYHTVVEICNYDFQTINTYQ